MGWSGWSISGAVFEVLAAEGWGRVEAIRGTRWVLETGSMYWPEPGSRLRKLLQVV